MNFQPSTPFFIIGSGRSGTTMLRLMLNMHSRTRVPRESWFLMSLIDALPNRCELTEEQRLLAFEIIRTHPRWPDWECEDSRLATAVMDGPSCDLATVIDKVFRACSGMDGRARWGDKTPKYSLYSDKLAGLFPEAHFIHVIRDARDVFLSMKRAAWYGGSPRRIGRYWSGTTGAALQLRTLCPERYHEVHYERLVADTERELKDLCRFLGEDYEARMLDFYVGASDEIAPWETKLHEKTCRAPRPTDVGRWKRELPLILVFLYESVVADRMREVGQQPHFGKCWQPLQAIVRVVFRLHEWEADVIARIFARCKKHFDGNEPGRNSRL